MTFGLKRRSKRTAPAGRDSYVAPDWTADWLHREAIFMQNLRWMRVPGDTIFFLGAVALVLFVAGLKTGHSFQRKL